MSVHDDCTGYDFAAGTINGLRGFNVDDLGRLRGVHHSAIWKPGENSARCGDKQGRCDSDDHGCGFWAYHDGTKYDSGLVHGIIEGYGRTTVGTKGFRCERAKVVALCLPERKRAAEDGPNARPAVKRWLFGWWLALALVNLAGLALDITTDPWWFTALSGGALGCTATCAFLAARPVPKRCQHVIAHRFRDCDCNLRNRWLDPFRFHGIDYGKRPELTDAVEAKLRRNYPDVTFYDSLAAMKAAHPVDPAVEPNPDNDPTFWDEEPEPNDDGLTWTLTTKPNTWHVSGYIPPSSSGYRGLL